MSTMAELDQLCQCPPRPDVMAQLMAQPDVPPGDNPTPHAPAFGVSGLGGGLGRKKPKKLFGLNDGNVLPQTDPDAVTAAALAPSGVPALAAVAPAVKAKLPLRGSVRLIVTLVEFPDLKMSTTAKAKFQDLFFGPKNSVKAYYKEVSGGLVDMTGEVVGPFMLPLKLTQYARGGCGSQNPKTGVVDEAPNVRDMAQHALKLANEKGKVDFSKYDNDGDKYVDAFVVVHAGMGAEEDPSLDGKKIWSVQWVLPGNTGVQVDGVKVYSFLTVPETARLGVCVHELGHLVFRWPDLYDADYSSQGVGKWCVMGGGSWGGNPTGSQPCHPSAWCKASATAQWVELEVCKENCKVELADVKTPEQGKIVRLWKDGDAKSKEYFLVENRQKTKYDTSLPAEGLLIWHVDDAVDGNENERHPQVRLVQADGLDQLLDKDGAQGDTGDPFPGNKGNRTFDGKSVPNSNSYARQSTKVAVLNISTPAPVMTMEFKITDDVEPPKPPKPETDL